MSKRRFSLIEREGAATGEAESAPSAAGNVPKEARCGPSPTKEELSPRELINRAKEKLAEKDYEAAAVAVSTLQDTDLTEEDLIDKLLIEFYSKKYVTLLDVILSISTYHTFTRKLRFFHNRNGDRVIRLDDAIVLKLLSQKMETPALTNADELLVKIKKEESQAFYAELMKSYPKEPKPEDGDKLLEDVLALLTWFFTHPLGRILNASVVFWYNNDNRSLRIRIDEDKKKRQRKATTTPATPTTPAASSSSSKYNLRPSSAIKSKYRKSDEQEEPEEPVNWFPDMTEEDFEKLDRDTALLLESLDLEEKLNTLPKINVYEAEDIPMRDEDVWLYDEIFAVEEAFFTTLSDCCSRLTYTRSSGIERLDNLLHWLEDQSLIYAKYFKSYIKGVMEICKGNLTAAEKAIAEGLNNFKLCHKQNAQSKLYDHLTNSLHLLKALVHLCGKNYEACFENIKIVLETDKCNSDAHNLVVKMLLDHDHLEEAISYMKTSTFSQLEMSDPIKTIWGVHLLYLKVCTAGESQVHLNGHFYTLMTNAKQHLMSTEIQFWLTYVTMTVLKKNLWFFEKSNSKILTALALIECSGPPIPDTIGFYIRKTAKMTFETIKYPPEKSDASQNDFDEQGIFTNPNSNGTEERLADLTKIMRMGSNNYLMNRLFHKYVADEWIHLNTQLHKQNTKDLIVPEIFPHN